MFLMLLLLLGKQPFLKALGQRYFARSMMSSPVENFMKISPPKLETSQSDDRLYDQFYLENGIPVTVVSDVKSEKSSACLAIRVGAAADPLPGIAHITEHAVFLGSEKYPKENEYKQWLSKNGGGSNGGTGMESTSYKFNVNAGAFEHTLDIFSQFFKTPLFDW